MRSALSALARLLVANLVPAVIFVLLLITFAWAVTGLFVGQDGIKIVNSGGVNQWANLTTSNPSGYGQFTYIATVTPASITTAGLNLIKAPAGQKMKILSLELIPTGTNFVLPAAAVHIKATSAGSTTTLATLPASTTYTIGTVYAGNSGTTAITYPANNPTSLWSTIDKGQWAKLVATATTACTGGTVNFKLGVAYYR